MCCRSDCQDQRSASEGSSEIHKLRHVFDVHPADSISSRLGSRCSPNLTVTKIHYRESLKLTTFGGNSEVHRHTIELAAGRSVISLMKLDILYMKDFSNLPTKGTP
jgi:hypothetical protein